MNTFHVSYINTLCSPFFCYFSGMPINEKSEIWIWICLLIVVTELSGAQFRNNQRVLFARSPDFKLQAQLALKRITGNPIIIYLNHKQNAIILVLQYLLTWVKRSYNIGLQLPKENIFDLRTESFSSRLSKSIAFNRMSKSYEKISE